MATGRRREGWRPLGSVDPQVAEESLIPTYGSQCSPSLNSWSRPGRDPVGIVS